MAATFPAPLRPSEIGLYVDGMISGSPTPYTNILGDVAKEDALLLYCQNNSITAISLYNMGNVDSGGMVSAQDDVVFNTNGKNKLRAFVQKARTTYGITNVTLIGNIFRINATNFDGTLQYLRFVDYNNTVTDPLQRIQWANIENEFWNWDDADINQVGTGTVTTSTSTRDVTGSGTNFGTGDLVARNWIKVGSEFRQIAEVVSATLLRVDRPFLSASTSVAFNFGYQGAAPNTEFQVHPLTFIERVKNLTALLRANNIKFMTYLGNAASGDLQALTPYVDRFLLHDYVSGAPRYNYMRTRLQAVATPKAGTITTSGTTLTGVGTSFLTQIAVGTKITVNGIDEAVVATVTSNTAATLVAAFPSNITTPSAYYNKVEFQPIISVESTTFYAGCANPSSCTGTPSVANNFSGYWIEGKNTSGVASFSPSNLQTAYTYIVRSAFAPTGSRPTQTTPSYNDETDLNIQRAINNVGVIAFSQSILRQLSTQATPNSTWSLVSPAPICRRSFLGAFNINSGSYVGTTISGSTITGYSFYANPTFPLGVPLNRDISGRIIDMSPPASFDANNININGLGGLDSGTYAIELFMADGTYYYVNNAIVQENNPITDATVVIISELCAGLGGGINVTSVTGGVAPYEYRIVRLGDGARVFQPINTPFTGLNTPSSWTILIRDAQGCIMSYDALAEVHGYPPHPTVPQVDPITFTLAKTDENCAASNGTITFSAITGGVGATPYQYSVDNRVTWGNSPVVTGLPQGTYQCAIRDANGCRSSVVPITVGRVGSITGTITDSSGGFVLCPNVSLLQIYVNPTSGTAPYTYAWSSSNPFTDFGATIEITQAGTYQCVVTDANGCQVTLIARISNGTLPVAPIITATPTQLSSCGGTVRLQVTNYSAPVDIARISWSSGEVGVAFIDVNYDGAFYAQYNSPSGCVNVSNIITLAPVTGLAASIVKSDESCVGCSDGTTTVIVSGGSPPYTYAWSDGQTTQTAFNLTAGTYECVVTDAVGCDIAPFTTINAPVINIPQPPPIPNTIPINDVQIGNLLQRYNCCFAAKVWEIAKCIRDGNKDIITTKLKQAKLLASMIDVLKHWYRPNTIVCPYKYSTFTVIVNQSAWSINDTLQIYTALDGNGRFTFEYLGNDPFLSELQDAIDLYNLDWNAMGLFATLNGNIITFEERLIPQAYNGFVPPYNQSVRGLITIDPNGYTGGCNEVMGEGLSTVNCLTDQNKINNIIEQIKYLCKTCECGNDVGLLDDIDYNQAINN
jgi:hypothetical protein